MARRLYGAICISVVLSLMICSGSFAQDIPVLDGLGLSPQPELSTQALEQARNQFEEYAPRIRDFAANLPPEMETKIDAMLVEIETKLDALKEIKVYMTTQDYDTVHAAYAQVPELTLDDVNAKEFEAFLRHKNAQVKAATDAPPPLPAHPIPEETRERLRQLHNADALKATRAKKGKSRISILSVYIDPVDYTLIEQTTVVISTDK